MRKNLSLFFVIAAALFSCTHADTDKEKQRILAAYKEERKARVLGDFVYFKEAQTNDLISVHDGSVEHISSQRIKDSLQKFFKTSQYDVWDDAEPPIINISEDGTMAYVISKINVRRSMQNKQGTITQEEFIYAGLSAYVKSDDRWLKTAEAWTVSSASERN